MNALLDQLKDSINQQLDLCDSAEIPIICAQLQTEETREKLVEAVVKKVVEEKMDIPQAIIAINNELDPNYID